MFPIRFSRATPSPLVRSFSFVAAGLLSVCAVPASAYEAELVSRLSKGDTALGGSQLSEEPLDLVSADGRFVVFTSATSDVMTSAVDNNPGNDVYLLDRLNCAVTLVSHVPGMPGTAGNGISVPYSITSDGAWVLFESESTDLIAGGTDTNVHGDLFLFERATGEVRLITHAANSPLVAASIFSRFTDHSADGRYIVYHSAANNLVAGVTDQNSELDVFVYDRLNNTSMLVSGSAAGPNVTANSESMYGKISANGQWIAYSSRSGNVIAGVTDTDGGYDAFLFDRNGSGLTLISRSVAAANVSGNGDSQIKGISGDGRWVLFESSAANMTVQSDTNVVHDAFLFDRNTGTVKLVSRSQGNPNQAANASTEAEAISVDGQWVLMSSLSSDLIIGMTDVSPSSDVFLFNHVSGARILVSHASSSPLVAALGGSGRASMSDNAERIYFASGAHDLIAGQIDANDMWDLFVFERASGTTVAVSASDATTSASAYIDSLSISADGRWLMFESNLVDQMPGLVDSNNAHDAFLFDVSTRTRSLVSANQRSIPMPSGNPSYEPRVSGISSDGRYILVNTEVGTALAPGVTDINGAYTDAYIFDRATQTHMLISRAAEDPTQTAWGPSGSWAISDSGEFVLFSSEAANIVSGVADGNQSRDLFVFDRLQQESTLVTRSADSATTTANGFLWSAGFSNEAEWIAFTSTATDLMTGVVDTNAERDLFLFERATGSVRLISRAAGNPTHTANGAIDLVSISGDGRWVLFRSTATNLVAGVSDVNGLNDVFLYDRDSDETVLVSRSLGSATLTANGASGTPSISEDGRYVLFSSLASDIVSGIVDTNAVRDIFLFDRLNGTSMLISRSSNTSTITANGQATTQGLSADGTRVLYSSMATDVVSGVVDGNGGNDVFLYDLANSSTTLVSHAASASTATANSSSLAARISPDGQRIALESYATDVVSGVVDTNAGRDVFLFDIAANSSSLLSHAAGLPSQAAGAGSVLQFISADGGSVVFTSAATNLAPRALDFNGIADPFVVSTGGPIAVFADGYEGWFCRP